MTYIDRELYSILGNALRDARDQAQLTLADAAQAIGVTTMTIQRYEKAERKANVETVRKLCSVYNVDADQLMQDAIDKFQSFSNNSLARTPGLSDEEVSLLSDYRKLNNDGQKVLLSAAKGLVMSGQYCKK